MTRKNLRTLIHELSYRPAERVDLFRSIPIDQQPYVLKRLSDHVLRDLALKLEEAELVTILEKLDPDEASDVLRLLPQKKQQKLIEDINQELRTTVTMLLSFEPDTAADLMSLDYILVENTDTITQVSQQVYTHEKRTGKLPIILVRQDSSLLGFIPGHRLGLAQPKEIAGHHVQSIATIPYDAKETQVLKFFEEHPHSKVVVLGKNHSVIGIIFSDDIIQLLHKQESASLYDFAGVNEEESIYDSVRRKVNFRYRWLIINLGTVFFAAFTVSLFEAAITRHVLLAIYMPIVAGMGGNAGTQTLAVMVRGLSQHELSWPDVLKTLKSEALAGFINGVINGLIVFCIVMLVNQNLGVAVVLGISMVVNLVIAASFGTFVPVLMKKLGKDPASSATIFITTATDVFGFLVFLGLATILLS